MAMLKQLRHSAISDIVRTSRISNQDDLRRTLMERGFRVTQATLSRDARELQLFKGPSGYTAASSNISKDGNDPLGISELFHRFGLEVRQATNLLVLLTATGSAQPVAAGIDHKHWPEVVGTIAGDDTVLVICTDDRQAKLLKARMEGYIG